MTLTFVNFMQDVFFVFFHIICMYIYIDISYLYYMLSSVIDWNDEVFREEIISCSYWIQVRQV